MPVIALVLIAELYIEQLLLFREWIVEVVGTIDADFDEINLGFDDFMEDWLKEHPEDEVEFVINTEYGGGSLPDFTELCEAYFNYQKEGYEADIANAETATASYEKSTYTINAYTDASGNNIKDEEIVFDNNNSLVSILQLLQCLLDAWLLVCRNLITVILQKVLMSTFCTLKMMLFR